MTAGEVAKSVTGGRTSADDSFREHQIRSWVAEVLHRRPVIGLAVGVVFDERLVFFSGHGLADAASGRPITEKTVFRIGSITKTFTAMAVMQLWEQGLIDLDAPANTYLRALRLTVHKADFKPPTVRHLLTHTSGVPEVLHPIDVVRPLFGESVRRGRPVPSLADYYKRGLPVLTDPGTRFTYTDHGFAALGRIVEEVAASPLEDYLRAHIFEPLGMEDTDLVRADRLRPRLATGYTLGTGGVEEIPDYELVTAGGGGAYSTSADMARYTAALLDGGANQHGSVLKPDTLALMFQPHYQPDPRVPGVGLAFGRAVADGHRLIEHGGIMPGFDSQLVVAPNDGIGVLAFTNGARRAMFWLPNEVTRLIRHLLDIPDETVHAPHHPELWAALCGRYPLSARFSDVRARLAAGAGAEVLVRDGQLRLRVLTALPAAYRGFPLVPDDPHDPYMFRIDLSRFGLGMLRVVFGRDPDGRVTAVHLVDGKPLSARRRPAGRNRRPSVSDLHREKGSPRS